MWNTLGVSFSITVLVVGFSGKVYELATWREVAKATANQNLKSPASLSRKSAFSFPKSEYIQDFKALIFSW